MAWRREMFVIRCARTATCLSGSILRDSKRDSINSMMFMAALDISAVWLDFVNIARWASLSLASMAKLRIQFARNNNGAVVSRIGRKSHSVDSVPPKKLASSSSPSKSIISMHQITQNASPCLSFQSLDHEITMTFRTNPVRTGACPTPGALVMAQCVRGPQRTYSRFIHSFSLTF